MVLRPHRVHRGLHFVHMSEKGLRRSHHEHHPEHSKHHRRRRRGHFEHRGHRQGRRRHREAHPGGQGRHGGGEAGGQGHRHREPAAGHLRLGHGRRKGPRRGHRQIEVVQGRRHDLPIYPGRFEAPFHPAGNPGHDRHRLGRRQEILGEERQGPRIH